MKLMCGCTKQAFPYNTGTQNATFTRLICVSHLEHLRPNLSNPIQKKLYNERTHKI